MKIDSCYQWKNVPGYVKFTDVPSEIFDAEEHRHVEIHVVVVYAS